MSQSHEDVIFCIPVLLLVSFLSQNEIPIQMLLYSFELCSCLTRDNNIHRFLPVLSCVDSRLLDHPKIQISTCSCSHLLELQIKIRLLMKLSCILDSFVNSSVYFNAVDLSVLDWFLLLFIHESKAMKGWMLWGIMRIMRVWGFVTIFSKTVKYIASLSILNELLFGILFSCHSL